MCAKVNKNFCSDECVVNFMTRVSLAVYINGQPLSLVPGTKVTVRRKHSGSNVVFIEVFGVSESTGSCSSDFPDKLPF